MKFGIHGNITILLKHILRVSEVGVSEEQIGANGGEIGVNVGDSLESLHDVFLILVMRGNLFLFMGLMQSRRKTDFNSV